MPVPPCRPDSHLESAPTSAGETPSADEIASLLSIARQAVRHSGVSHADSDDIAQTVVERLWRTWNSPHVLAARQRGTRSWHGYVRAAARNASHDLRRSTTRRARRELRAFDHVAGPLNADPPAPADHRRTTRSADVIDDYLARVEILEVIRTVLTDRERLVAWRIFFDGWSVNQVAAELGLSPRTIRQERANAIAKIRESLLS